MQNNTRGFTILWFLIYFVKKLYMFSQRGLVFNFAEACISFLFLFIVYFILFFLLSTFSWYHAEYWLVQHMRIHTTVRKVQFFP